MKIIRSLVLVPALLTALAVPMLARADMTFDFEIVVSGDTPDGDTPWATLLCEDTDAGEVTFTLTNTSGGDNQFLTELNLNFDGDLPGNFAITWSDTSILDADWGEDAFNDAGSSYDVRLQFATSNSGDLRILPGESVIFTITGDGVECLDFDTLSTPTGDGDGYLALLHIQGTSGLEGSSKVAPVPEPASMAALAVGALGILARRRRK